MEIEEAQDEVEPLQLFETYEPTIPKRVIDRAAFGRFVKPELYDMFGEHDLGELSDEEKAWMNPRNLAHNLFGRSKDDTSVVNGVALNGYEYKLVARSPKKLAETAITNTLASDDVTEELLERSQRAGRHILEDRLPKMLEHRTALRERRDSIKDLKHRAEFPGRAHKPEAYMRQSINLAWTEFVTMLDAIHIQRKWSDEQRHKVESSFLNFMVQGSQRVRTAHWKEMLNLAINYLDVRIGIFTRKTEETEALLDTMTGDAAE